MEDIIRVAAHGLGLPIGVGLVTSDGARMLDQRQCHRIARDVNYVGELEAEAVRNAFADVTKGER